MYSLLRFDTITLVELLATPVIVSVVPRISATFFDSSTLSVTFFTGLPTLNDMVTNSVQSIATSFSS